MNRYSRHEPLFYYYYTAYEASLTYFQHHVVALNKYFEINIIRKEFVREASHNSYAADETKFWWWV